MGNYMSTSHPDPSQSVNSSLADSSHDEPVLPRLVNESLVFITLEIFHELPDGSPNKYTVRVNPMKKVIEIKQKLAKIVGIPCEHMQIYRHQNPQTEMPNNRCLDELEVPDYEQLRVRDRRQVYTNPITVQY